MILQTPFYLMPYADLVEAMRTTHRRLQAIHEGTTPPFNTKPRPQ